MIASIPPEPDPAPASFNVGQDCVGHWLVQQSDGQLEGRFVSFQAAMAFARSESSCFPGARIVMATAPLVPTVSFAPVQSWERAACVAEALR